MKAFTCILFFWGYLLFFSAPLFAQPLSVSITPNQPALECDSQGGDFYTTVTGGSSPYTYQWSSGQTTKHISNLTAGTYTITVTDAVLATASATFTFTSLPYFYLNTGYHAPTPGECNGAILINIYDPTIALSSYSPYMTIDNATYWIPVCNPGSPVTSEVYSYPSNCPAFNNGAILNPTLLFAGPYSVINTSSQGQNPCSNTSFNILNQSPFNVNALPTNWGYNTFLGYGAKITDIQGNTIDSISYFFGSQVQILDTSIIDFGINLTGTFIFEFVDGIIYDLNGNIYDTIGIQLKDTFNLISFDCGTLSGNVFFDENGNCVFDQGTDTYLPNTVLNIQPDNVNILTNDSGHYSAYLPYGNYSITQTNSYGLDQKCPNSPANFTLNNLNTNVNLNFADTAIAGPQCDLKLSLGTSAARPGLDYELLVKVINSNLLATSPTTLTLDLDSTLTFISANNGGQYLNNTITWNVPSMIGFEEVYFSALMNIPPSTPIGTILTTNASIIQLLCDTIAGNNTISHQRTVTGSYDPNEKSVSPVGVGPQNIIPPDYRLQYTIDFENVGNDTAFRVIVIDTLSANLDVSSLQVEMSSHDYFVQINSPNILRFTFENILLPDSATNTEASKGFITFSINQMPGLSDGTNIENNAAIYFDYNLPIITNTIFNTIKDGPVAECQNLNANLDSNGNATIDPQLLNNGSYDFYGISGYAVSQNSFDCNQTGVNSVTFYVTSVNGLTDSCAATVTVVDNISPVVFCQDTIISMDSSCFATISPQDLITGSSDNCSPLSYSLSQNTFDCTNIGLNNVTLTVTDASGNTTQCPVIVTIVDATGIHNPHSPLQNASLIPNPSSGKLQLPEITQGGSLIVSDCTGRIVHSENNIKQLEKDFTSFPEGIYIFKFVTGFGEVRLKWVKID